MGIHHLHCKIDEDGDTFTEQSNYETTDIKEFMGIYACSLLSLILRIKSSIKYKIKDAIDSGHAKYLQRRIKVLNEMHKYLHKHIFDSNPIDEEKILIEKELLESIIDNDLEFTKYRIIFEYIKGWLLDASSLNNASIIDILNSYCIQIDLIPSCVKDLNTTFSEVSGGYTRYRIHYTN